MRHRQNILRTLNRLAAVEAAFLRREFLAPICHGVAVRVRIDGVICSMHVSPANFHGWAVLQPTSHASARIVRSATMAERQKYLALFPPVRLVIARRNNHSVEALPADGEHRFAIDGAVPLWLAQDAELFDVVVARFDGQSFWFDELDPTADPAGATYLRESLGRMVVPSEVERPRLTAAQRDAYAQAHAARVVRTEVDRHAQAEHRLRTALAHAGADLRDFADAGDGYRVRYVVDGQQHLSIVRKNDLTVHAAGICLSGRDRDFDLQSLVGVLREGG
jgi:hypothetical protein